MIERASRFSSIAAGRAKGRRVLEDALSPAVAEMTAGGLNKLLALLVALTLVCGAAAAAAVILAPASVDSAGDGY